MTDATVPLPRPSLLRSAAIQRRVILALLMREIITRFGRRNLGVLWLVAEPMMFTMFVAALWTAIARPSRARADGSSASRCTGYSSVLMWRNSW